VTVTYRRFVDSIDDAAGVLEVEAACWNEATCSPQNLAALFQSTEQVQVCWLAEAAGQVVGFMHAFATFNGGVSTWELDLLAVHPDWRRRGIATELVRRATRDAPSSAARARSMIATSNTPSAKAFQRVGFGTDTTLSSIYVLDTPGGDDPSPEWPPEVAIVQQPGKPSWVAAAGRSKISLLGVRTVLYDGLWVEGFAGDASPELLAAALAHATQQSLDVVGLIVPASDTAAISVVQAAGYESLGDYLTWTHALPVPE
jgi:ribosomal protein S18 acetylase RimI-like enzyme